MKLVIESPLDGYQDKYLKNRYYSLFNTLDKNYIDTICNNLFIRGVGKVYICRMNDNSYSIYEGFKEDKLVLISKGHRKREMIKNGYIKRNSQIRREDRVVNNNFRKSKWYR